MTNARLTEVSALSPDIDTDHKLITANLTFTPKADQGNGKINKLILRKNIKPEKLIQVFNDP